jgi:hypothetical protein
MGGVRNREMGVSAKGIYFGGTDEKRKIKGKI